MLSSGFLEPGGGSELVVLAGAEHCEDFVAAAAGEADDGGVVSFAFGAFAVVEGFGVR